jgi:hypothetical protein
MSSPAPIRPLLRCYPEAWLRKSAIPPAEERDADEQDDERDADKRDNDRRMLLDAFRPL